MVLNFYSLLGKISLIFAAKPFPPRPTRCFDFLVFFFRRIVYKAESGCTLAQLDFVCDRRKRAFGTLRSGSGVNLK